MTDDVTPGDLARMTIHDDPVEVAAALRQWFGPRFDDGSELLSVTAAVAWLRAVAAALEATP